MFRIMKIFLAIVVTVALTACSTVTVQSSDRLGVPRSVKSLYDEGVHPDDPTFVTIRGRLNLFNTGAPSTFLMLSDLRDPLGYSANYVEENVAERIFEQFNEVDEGLSRFPYIYVNPVKPFHGHIPGKKLYEVMLRVVESLRNYENKCVVISGLAVANRLHSDLEDLDFATIAPYEIRECSAAEDNR